MGLAGGLNLYTYPLNPVTEVDPLGLEGGWNLYSYAFNNPVKFVDPRGLDIWLEGASRNLTDGATDEPYLHMSVSVGKWGQDYSSYSFGSSFLLYGEVYKDPYPNGFVLQYKKTTPEQDALFKKEMDAMVGNWGIYGVTDICRSWSIRQFENAPGKLAERPSQILPGLESPSIFSTTTRGVSTTTNTGVSK